jgi:hypothetical protein
MSLDEVRKQIHSKIRVNDLPDSREFIFPALRNPGFASGATIFWLIWTGVVVLLAWKKAPFIFPLMFGAIDLLMAVFAFDLLFRRSRVVVTRQQLKVETSWLAFKKEFSLDISNVSNFSADVGATAGHSAYFDLKVHAPEADWLARQLAAATKRFSATNPDA